MAVLTVVFCFTHAEHRLIKLKSYNNWSAQAGLSLKRGKRLTIFQAILHSEQFEVAEFTDGNSFLWFLTPANVGTCLLSGHSFERRTANASILTKFCSLHKSRVVSSMVTIVFCNFLCPPILTPVNAGTYHLLGHSFGEEWQMLQFHFVLYTKWGWWIQ